MEDSDQENYLGDLLTTDGSNTKNIKDRKAKGFGIVDKICSMLEEMFFGPFHIETALLFRTTHLISSILFNSEVWYGLRKVDLEELESVDQALLRKILEAPASTPIPMLYLELGVTPFRYIIMSRRLMYLQYMLQEEDDALLKNFFMAQMGNPVRDDWIEEVRKNIEEIKLDDTSDQIKAMSKEVFQTKIRIKVRKAALKYLTKEKAKLSKVMDVPHKELKIQSYFYPMKLSVQQAKLLFQLRTRMVDVKVNYRNKYIDIFCPVCKIANDSQQHLFDCPELTKKLSVIVNSNVQYTHIFSDEIEKQISALTMFETLWKQRKIYLEKNKE